MKKMIVVIMLISVLFLIIEVQAQNGTWINLDNGVEGGYIISRSHIIDGGYVKFTSIDRTNKEFQYHWDIYRSGTSDIREGTIVGLENAFMCKVAIGPDIIWVYDDISRRLFKYDVQVWGNEDPVTTIFTKENGLSITNVTSLAIDNITGDLWIASLNAVVKYDGQVWEKYFIPGVITTIAVNPITSEVWAGGTWGLYKYDGQDWSEEDWLILHEDDMVLSVAVNPVTNEIWAGTRQGKIYRYDGEAVEIYTKENTSIFSGEGFCSAAVDLTTNEAWFATSAGAYRFDGQNWTLYTKADGLEDNNVRKIKVSSNGIVWCETSNHVITTVSRFIPSGPTAVDESQPAIFSIDQNYPNPFNPTTTISFILSESGDVKIDVFNLAGQNVAMLMDEYLSVGHHSVVWNASGFSAGTYLYTIKAGDFFKTMKMVLLK